MELEAAAGDRPCTPRNQSSSLERSGEGGGLQCSPMLSAARESIAVSSGSDSGNATLTDGGSAAELSSPEPSSPSDAAIDILSFIRWHSKRDAGPCPVRGSSELVRKHQMVQCAGGMRGPRRRTRRGSSHSDPQITLTMSRSSPPRDGGTRTGHGKGDTPSFDEEVSGPQHCDGHVPAMRTWPIHECCFSVLIAQARDTAIVTVRWSQETYGVILLPNVESAFL